ncbi:hypothetical protein GGI13_003009, partial [Coemansia sp. RSA 455]
DSGEDRPSASDRSSQSDSTLGGGPAQRSKEQLEDLARAKADSKKYFVPKSGCHLCFNYRVELEEAALSLLSATRKTEYHWTYMRDNCHDRLVSIKADIAMYSAQVALNALVREAKDHAREDYLEMVAEARRDKIVWKLQEMSDGLAQFRRADSRRGDYAM